MWSAYKVPVTVLSSGDPAGPAGNVPVLWELTPGEGDEISKPHVSRTDEGDEEK